MANSLLAHLYSRIKGSQEDIATISLQYLLAQSKELNYAFTELINTSFCNHLVENLNYIEQVTGEEKDRPDMVGLDSFGKEQVICEMKFYAGLTQNQPLTYIQRLKNNQGVGLVFICPKARQSTLWTKLKELCQNQCIVEVGQYVVKVNEIYMSIITWAEVIEKLRLVASSSVIEYLADIQQLDGYCAQMDSDAFIPFEENDLTSEMAKKIGRYYDIVDEVINLLHGDKNYTTSLKGLRANAYRDGYTRSFYIDNNAISLNFDRKLWKSTSSIETPFWLAIREKDWKQTSSILEQMKQIPEQYKDDKQWSITWIALEPKLYLTFDEVCEDLKSQVIKYLNIVNNIDEN